MSFSQLCELMRQGRRGAHILYWDVEETEVFLDMICRPDSDIIEMKTLFVMLEEGKGRIGQFNEEMMRHEWRKKEEQDVTLN